MKYIKQLNIDFNNWDEYNDDINSFLNRDIYNKFKIGDIIECDIETPSKRKHITGTIKCLEDNDVLIEFNDDINGHSGESDCRCHNYNCWWYDDNDYLYIHKIHKIN